MGILLRHVPSGDLLFYVKGADAVMTERVIAADWLEEEIEPSMASYRPPTDLPPTSHRPSTDLPLRLEEETGNLAREGLRTLVVACRPLTEAQYAEFAAELAKARLAKTGRNAAVRAAFAMLEEEMLIASDCLLIAS